MIAAPPISTGRLWIVIWRYERLYTRAVVHVKYAARRPALFANAKIINGLALKITRRWAYDWKRL